MSKTDKTKPWAVRVMEHNPWADHDHSDGICDLPKHHRDNRYSTWNGEKWVYGAFCRWSDWNLVRPGECCYGCGCRLCTGYWERRWERRRDRHKTRRDLRKEMKEARANS